MCCRVFRHPCVLRVSVGRGGRAETLVVCASLSACSHRTLRQSHVFPNAWRVSQHGFLAHNHDWSFTATCGGRSSMEDKECLCCRLCDYVEVPQE